MPAPVWMAFPPEVHSASLSSGPGPGPLLAAAQTWTALSIEYQAAATELEAVLADAQQVWEGPTAAKYVTAHGPYLEWLSLAGTVSAEAAARHEVVAGAYTAALAAMPTLVELAANHAIHAALVASNFFGINTIPIAVNEADYARMWTQAAATMSTYQATTEAAQAANGGGGGGGGGNGFQLPTPAEIWAMIFGADGERFPGQGQPNWGPIEYLENLPNFISGNEQALTYLQTNLPQVLTNPYQLSALMSYFVAWQTFRIVNWTVRTLRFIVQIAPLLLPAVLNLAVTNLAGLAGLSGLAGLGRPLAPPAPVAPTPVAVSPQLRPVPFTAVPAFGTGPAPMATAPPAPASPTPATIAAPPPAPHVEALGYLVGGPGPDFGPTLGARIRAEAPAWHTNAAAAAVAAENREQARAARRPKTVIDRGYRHEYLEADDESGIGGGAADYMRSGHGAGPLGFTGTLPKTGARPAGLTAMAGGAFSGGPGLPMVPSTWADGHEACDGQESGA
jgi:PPE-repeat protein